MKFNCKDLSISDDDFTCTISLTENLVSEELELNFTIDQLMDAWGQYITLQCSYLEDDFEESYYYFESSDFEKSGELTDYIIYLSRTQFVLNFKKELYEIDINVDDQEFEMLKKALPKLINSKGQLHFIS